MRNKSKYTLVKPMVRPKPGPCKVCSSENLPRLSWRDSGTMTECEHGHAWKAVIVAPGDSYCTWERLTGSEERMALRKIREQARRERR